MGEIKVKKILWKKINIKKNDFRKKCKKIKRIMDK